MHAGELHVGDLVRLKKGRSKKTARVIGYLIEVKGGIVLDEPIEGFKCWNVSDLKRIPERNRKP